MSSNQFTVYKDRLKKKGLIYSPGYGRIAFTLPRFDVYVKYMEGYL